MPLQQGRVEVNGHPARFVHNRSLPQSRAANAEEPSLSALKATLTKAHARHRGDLIIEIPRECDEAMAEQRVLRVLIDATVRAPTEGVNFVITSANTNQHVYTYRSQQTSPNSTTTREWLPCLDSAEQLALWRFEVEVPNALTAVCCGDMVDVVPRLAPGQFESTERTFFYQLMVSVFSGLVGFGRRRVFERLWTYGKDFKDDASFLSKASRVNEVMSDR